MKRALTQKINPIPACTADCSMVGSFKPVPPEVNRRARTSAAMIGLAISMGASSSVLLPRQGDSAVATEPKANWAVSTVTNALTETMGSQEVKSVTGQALDPKPLANQNQELPANASSTVGNSGNQIPLLNHGSDGSESQSATIEQPAVLSETSESEPATTASSVNQLLKVKQAVALNRLKESSNRLRNSLAEWKSEESSIKSSVAVSEPVVPTVVSRQLQPILESSPAVEPVSPQWQAQVATIKPTEVGQPEAKAELGQQLQAEEPTVSVVYQVRPGDTIEAIARKYNVSVATLAKANELDNPNRIRVAQQLKVPQNTVSALPTSTQQLGTNYSEFQPVSPNLAPETLSSNAAPNLPVVSALLPQPITENAPADVTAAAFPLTQRGTDDVQGWDVSANEPVETISAPATGNKFLSASKPTSETHKDNLSAQTQNNQFVLAENFTNQEPDNRTKQYSNPYVERLRAEILQLRQHGRQQAGANPANNAWYGRTATPPAANTNNSSAQLRGTNNYPVNPDFRPNQYNQALQAEIQRRAEEAPANLPRTYYQIPPTQNTRQQRVATAPLGVDPYQPYNQNVPGQTVSPDLPPIENPYNNYPGTNQQMTGYIWPARGTLTSGYGWRWGRMHRGIDIAAPTGTPIFASAPGVVVYARWNSGGYGNLVQIRHPDGSLTRYAHNSRIFVQEGQIVEQGQNIAAMGSTGRSTGPHSHFEIHPDGQGAVNPIAFLPRN